MQPAFIRKHTHLFGRNLNPVFLFDGFIITGEKDADNH